MAQKLNVDGIALYELSEKKFLDEFGYEGRTIYYALQRSKYGYVSKPFKFSIKKILLILIQV